MDRADLANLLLNAPAWARIGLTVRDCGMRERAADELAGVIAEALDGQPDRHRDQLALPL